MSGMVFGVRLFLSHASTDLEVAETLRIRLEEVPGLTCFLLATDIFPGDDWEARIRRAACECDAIACLVTPDYIKRPWFYAEWAVFWFQRQKTWYLLMLDTSVDDVFEVMRRRQMTFLNDRRSVQRLLEGLAKGQQSARGFDLLAQEIVSSAGEARRRSTLAQAEANLARLALLMREGEDNVSPAVVDSLLEAGKLDELVAVALDSRSDSPTKRRQLAVYLVRKGHAASAATFDHLIANNAERRTVGRACLVRLKDDPQDNAARSLVDKIYKAVRDPQRRDLRTIADELGLDFAWSGVPPNP